MHHLLQIIRERQDQEGPADVCEELHRIRKPQIAAAARRQHREAPGRILHGQELTAPLRQQRDFRVIALRMQPRMLTKHTPIPQRHQEAEAAVDPACVAPIAGLQNDKRREPRRHRTAHTPAPGDDAARQTAPLDVRPAREQPAARRVVARLRQTTEQPREKQRQKARRETRRRREDRPRRDVDRDQHTRAKTIAQPARRHLKQRIRPKERALDPIRLPRLQRHRLLKRIRADDVRQADAVKIHQERHHRRRGEDLMTDGGWACGLCFHEKRQLRRAFTACHESRSTVHSSPHRHFFSRSTRPGCGGGLK